MQSIIFTLWYIKGFRFFQKITGIYYYKMLNYFLQKAFFRIELSLFLLELCRHIMLQTSWNILYLLYGDTLQWIGLNFMTNLSIILFLHIARMQCRLHLMMFVPSKLAAYPFINAYNMRNQFQIRLTDWFRPFRLFGCVHTTL